MDGGTADVRQRATIQKAPEAAEAAKTTKASEAAERPTGLVGTVIAYTPAYRTVVVDIPLGPKGDRDTLRLGAQVTDHTKITMGNATASTEALKRGEKVRIDYHRVSSGDVAGSVHILRPEKG